jgi:hypothetical protein
VAHPGILEHRPTRTDYHVFRPVLKAAIRNVIKPTVPSLPRTQPIYDPYLEPRLDLKARTWKILHDEHDRREFENLP